MMRRRCGRWPRRRSRRSRRAGCWRSRWFSKGASRAEAARSTGMDRQTLRDWVHRFNAEGPGALCDRKAPGRSRRLDTAQLAELKARVEAGPEPAQDGVVRWRLADLCELGGGPLPGPLPRARHGQDPALARLLPHLGAPGASPGRPRAASRVQKKLPELIAAAVGEKGRGKRLEIWFQDEARIGQKGELTRQWAPRGTRPRQPRDQRYQAAYLFGAVCPSRGAHRLARPARRSTPKP